MNLNRRVIAAVTLGLVCFVLTIAIFVQVKTTNTSNSTVAQTMEENDLRDQVLRMKEKYDNVYEELGNATKRLEQIRVDATKDDSEAKEKQNTMKTITTQSVNKLRANISYLKETATMSDIMSGNWIDGLSKSAQETFDAIKDNASSEYSTISLAMDLLKTKPIKSE